MALTSVDKFSRSIGPQIKMLRPIFEKYLRKLDWRGDPVSVMDVGVGDGRLAKDVIMPCIPNKLKEYVGCDISDEALQLANGKQKSSIFTTIKMDIATPHLPTEMINRFDKVFSNFTLHNLKKEGIEIAAKNIYKSLKSGGQIFLCTFKHAPQDPVYEELDKGEWSKYENWKAHSPFYKCNVVKEYNKVISSIGFTNCLVKLLPDQCVTFTERELEEVYISVNPRLQYVEENEEKKYIQDYFQILKSCNGTREVGVINGRKIFNMFYKIVVVLGTKSV